MNSRHCSAFSPSPSLSGKREPTKTGAGGLSSRRPNATCCYSVRRAHDAARICLALIWWPIAWRSEWLATVLSVLTASLRQNWSAVVVKRVSNAWSPKWSGVDELGSRSAMRHIAQTRIKRSLHIITQLIGCHRSRGCAICPRLETARRLGFRRRRVGDRDWTDQKFLNSSPCNRKRPKVGKLTFAV
jgi:hypothetical protein